MGVTVARAPRAVGVDYPASYYSGPLGQNNILPADDTGYLTMIWSGVAGQTAQQQRDMVTTRMTDAGRAFDCIGTRFSLNLATDDHLGTGGEAGRGETWIHAQGSVPVITWTYNADPADVAAGLHDADLQTVADRLSDSPFRIMLRWWREFNVQTGQLYYQGTTGSEATAWKDGWQYVVEFFQTAGATNVGFCWCPTEQAGRTGATGRDQTEACYPGDAYVDWVGVDRYNRGDPAAFSSPLHGGWATFNEIFNYNDEGYDPNKPSFHDTYGESKPICIWESSSFFDDGDTERKANWYRGIETAKDEMENLRGVQIFDQWTTGNENFDWRVDRDQTYLEAGTQGNVHAATYQGWKDWVASARANVGVLGGAT